MTEDDPARRGAIILGGGAPRRNGRIVRVVVAIVVVVDLLLLAGNLLFLTADEPREQEHPVFSDRRFNGDNDRSFPEIFGYLLVLVNAVLLAVLWRRRRGAVFGVLALIVAAILADDLFMLHERAGSWLTSVSDGFDIAGLGTQDVGEAMFWVLAALVLGSLFLVSYFRSNRPDRRRAVLIAVLLATLVFFAVGVDFLHSALIPHVSSFVITAITLLETFGELGSMTLLVVVLVSMVNRDHAESPSTFGSACTLEGVA